MGPDDKFEDWETKAEVDFNVFITSLGMQALIFMGEMANPLTNKTEVELPRAKYLIETISMIKEKTEGNLKEEEAKTIDDTLYILRLKYAEKAR